MGAGMNADMYILCHGYCGSEMLVLPEYKVFSVLAILLQYYKGNTLQSNVGEMNAILT